MNERVQRMTTKEKLVEAACGLFWIGLLAIGVLVLVGIVKAQQDPYQGVAPRDVALGAVLVLAQGPYQGVAPHGVPHCSPKGGEKSAPCSCLGMVNEVQTSRAEACWQDNGFPLPDDPKEKAELLAFLNLGAPTQDILMCLEKVPDHCQVVARGAGYWNYRGKHTCRTSCKPERCGCADEACKAHGSGAYGQPETGVTDGGVPY